MEINPQRGNTPIGNIQTEQVEVQPTSSVSQSTTTDESEIKGLTQEEYNDPNQIQITIADRNNPIVVLFGPPACGKTMTLVRLTRYLKENGYKVEPITSFRPAADSHYAEMCHNFNSMINSRKAADSTKNISFMLLKVMDGNGRTICQILEAPGEYYYNPQKPNENFPSYVNVIRSSTNRKIWCYMVEPSWKDEVDRIGYVDKIKSLKKNMRSADKTIFIFNKIDITAFVNSPGHINEREARLFAAFQSPGLLFGTTDNFDFIPLHTGDYTKDPAGGLFFDAGPDEYPKALWNTINKLVRG